MAIRQVPRGGDPEKVRLEPDGEKPPVIPSLTESREGDATLRRGSTSALMTTGDLALQEHGYTEWTSGIINRLPAGTKRMLGI